MESLRIQEENRLKNAVPPGFSPVHVLEFFVFVTDCTVHTVLQIGIDGSSFKLW